MSETISGLPSVAGCARLGESELAEVSGGIMTMTMNPMDPIGNGGDGGDWPNPLGPYLRRG